jgi:hypothetical protein
MSTKIVKYFAQLGLDHPIAIFAIERSRSHSRLANETSWQYMKNSNWKSICIKNKVLKVSNGTIITMSLWL